MTRLQEALLLAAALMAIALLAVFDIIPASFAQFAPLAVVPFVVRRRSACSYAARGC